MSLTHVDPHVSEILMVWIQSGDLLMVWIQISLNLYRVWQNWFDQIWMNINQVMAFLSLLYI
jgi:hypothetical protein